MQLIQARSSRLLLVAAPHEPAWIDTLQSIVLHRSSGLSAPESQAVNCADCFDREQRTEMAARFKTPDLTFLPSRAPVPRH